MHLRTELHGVTFQKTAIFAFTVARTSNLREVINVPLATIRSDCLVLRYPK
jgi:hypothetical protein